MGAMTAGICGCGKSARLSLIVTAAAGVAVAVAVAAAVGGCAPGSGSRVLALANPDVIALDADDTVRIMLRAGFTDQQVLDLGTDLRNALASGGAAQVRCDSKLEAIFAVDGRCVRIATRRRGMFAYNVETPSPP